MRILARATLAALLLGTGVLLPGPIAAPVALACSCVAPMPLAEYAGEGTVIFSGTVTADTEDGVLVEVDRWFSGDGAAPVILISGEFSNGASCGIGMRPAVGSSWLVVGWRPWEDGVVAELTGAPVSVNICQPFVDLATPEGQAMLDEAVATFGKGAPVPSTTTPAAPAPSPSVAGNGTGGLTTETLVAAGVFGTLVAGVVVLALMLLLARRDPR